MSTHTVAETKATYTRGPWRVAEIPGVSGWVDGADGIAVAICPSGTTTEVSPVDPSFTRNVAIRSKAEVEANGRLVAAAPDLLAALKLALSDEGGFSCPESTEAVMLAAIAKAEGR